MCLQIQNKCYAMCVNKAMKSLERKNYITMKDTVEVGRNRGNIPLLLRYSVFLFKGG